MVDPPLTVQLEAWGVKESRGVYVVNMPIYYGRQAFGPQTLRDGIDSARDMLIASIVGDASRNGLIEADAVTDLAISQMIRQAERLASERGGRT